MYNDCLGECGGGAVFDECGICNGPGPEENYNCDGSCDTNVAVDLWGTCYNIEETTTIDLTSSDISGSIPISLNFTTLCCVGFVLISAAAFI